MPQVIQDYLQQIEDLVALAKQNFAEMQSDVDEGNPPMGQQQYLSAMAYCVNAHQAVNELLLLLSGQQPHPGQDEVRVS